MRQEDKGDTITITVPRSLQSAIPCSRYLQYRTLCGMRQNRGMNNCQMGTESKLGHSKFEVQEKNSCENVIRQLGSWNRVRREVGVQG